MNVAYLKVTHGLRFHLFFFFLGGGLLICFHGHSCPSIMIICIQPQTWGARGCGCRNGVSRFVFFFLSNWDGAPPRVGALRKLCTLRIGSGGTDFYRPWSKILISHTPSAEIADRGHVDRTTRALKHRTYTPPLVHATGYKCITVNVKFILRYLILKHPCIILPLFICYYNLN